MHKDKLLLNRPMYVGAAILDLAKLLMYDFFYNQLQRQYGSNVEVLYTDTGSLVLHIFTDDVYDDMRHTHEWYDTSNYKESHPLFSNANKKVLGKMKDECAGTPISEFVGLRAKMYSILKADSERIHRAKGIKKSTVKLIQHKQYKQSLLELKEFKHGMDLIQTHGHRIYGVHITKTSLSPLDTKRWIHNDGIHTLAYGHKLT